MKRSRRTTYDAAVTCTNCGTSGHTRVEKEILIKIAIQAGLKCPWCKCENTLKPNIPGARS